MSIYDRSDNSSRECQRVFRLRNVISQMLRDVHPRLTLAFPLGVCVCERGVTVGEHQAVLF